MKLDVKNFSSENHRVVVETGGAILTAFYKEYDPELKGFFTIKVFVEAYKNDNYCEKLGKILKRVGEYTGLSLIKPEIKVAI